ncbi:glycosyltransferase family 4 protein [Salinicoccus luteus]|uniref:glycosyltransferase family 4 protein n=1 Tax=Salinicoccus luteus TaxID=367840 RepID=UPI0004E176D8|nr:glycosyltransferase family 4 protein [Salinicoccus luteus]
MNILHLCLCGPVTDNWNYQDNLLSKYHRKLGNSVTIITSQWIRDSKGGFIKSSKRNYYNEDDVQMIRLPIKRNKNLSYKFKSYKNLSKSIESVNPDVLFIHGCQFIDLRHIVKYLKKNPEVRVYLDNHADFLNSGQSFLSRIFLHRILWRSNLKKIEPFVKKFYGVLPARVNFLIEMYEAPKEKVELLVMGADDEKVKEAKNTDIVKTKNKYGIKTDDFLIATGGKINRHKTEVLSLMKAVNDLNNPNIKLIVFGSVDVHLKGEFNEMLGDNVKYVGWISSEETYKFMNICDLAIFPGLHSVLWEQAVGLGKPCIFKYIEGFTHIDLKGNCDFLYNDSIEEMKQKIISIYYSPEKLKRMQDVASVKGQELFSYRNIARQSLYS